MYGSRKKVYSFFIKIEYDAKKADEFVDFSPYFKKKNEIYKPNWKELAEYWQKKLEEIKGGK